MRIFSSGRDFPKTLRQDILAELRRFCERQKGSEDLRSDSFLSLTHGGEDQFFLKSPKNYVVWGKIYFDSFSWEHAEQLRRELGDLRQKFSQPIKLKVFFREGGIEPTFLEHYPDVEFFRYSVISSSMETAMVIDPLDFSMKLNPPKIFTDAGISSRPGYQCSKQSQLTRNELDELINLSLELKGR